MSLLQNVEIEEVEGKYFVIPVWRGVDRKTTGGISCGGNHSLAKRLQTAFLNKAVFKDEYILKDVNNKTFVSYTFTISSRIMNSELKKLGY